SRRYLTRAEFVQMFGAHAKHLDRIQAFAKRHGLLVISRDAATRTIVLSGRVRDISRAFAVRLARYSYRGGSYRGIDKGQSVRLPRAIAPLVLAVLGLENLPVARPRLQIARLKPRATFPPNAVA